MLTNKRDTINNKLDTNIHSVRNGSILNFNPDSKFKDRTMSHYERLVHHINELINDDGIYNIDSWELQFKNIEEDEQAKLVGLFIEADDLETYDCFFNADSYVKDDEVNCALRNLLKSNTFLNRTNFATAVIKQSIKNYASRIQDIIDEQCAWKTTEERT